MFYVDVNSKEMNPNNYEKNRFIPSCINAY
jgi:hypothetical protein